MGINVDPARTPRNRPKWLERVKVNLPGPSYTRGVSRYIRGVHVYHPLKARTYVSSCFWCPWGVPQRPSYRLCTWGTLCENLFVVFVTLMHMVLVQIPDVVVVIVFVTDLSKLVCPGSLAKDANTSGLPFVRVELSAPSSD